jgi:basic amino acid/polyamine antiporter, APA family
MIFWRVKPLDQILATAEKKSLKRQLTALQLTLLGIGAIIGTGIFVLTAEAATKAGPGMMISFVIAAVVCALTAMAYAEIASMVPVSGSAYTYSYAVFGEFLAWLVGWALVLEYAIAASAVAVGWSGYVNGLLAKAGFGLPSFLLAGPYDSVTIAATATNAAQTVQGSFNLLAFMISLVITGLLVIGTSKSAKVNSVLVSIKIAALTMFVILALPAINMENFHPFMPNGFLSHETTSGATGVMAAAASIFFAYVGFDAVSTAAEETINPNRNIPIGLIGSLAVCTIFYLLVAAGAVGAVGAQPGGELAMSKEPLAFVLNHIGYTKLGGLLALAAGLALPSVILMMIYGQTRIFFVMSRDGLLPAVFSKVHPKFHTPHVVTIITGIFVALFAAMFPVGKLADISNSGTLFAFFIVALGVMILRVKRPDKPRPFRVPLVWVVCPLAMLGCGALFLSLSNYTLKLFFGWAAIGIVVYFLYGYRKSELAKSS